MAWRDRLQKASFRGVEFYVDSADVDFGRRNVLHEYPYRDDPYGEDLGRKARTYNLTAYLLGEEYPEQRDRLIAAIEDRSEPGTLIHPTLGSIDVIPADGCKTSWSKNEGGIEYLTLVFVQAGENQYPKADIDTRAAILTKAETAQETVATTFEAKFDTDGFPEFVATDAETVSVAMADQIEAAGNAYPVDPEISPVLFGSVSDFVSEKSTLVRNPRSFVARVQEITNALDQVFPDALNAYKAFKRLLAFGDDFVPVPTTTTTRERQAQNRKAQVDLVRREALIGMAKAVPDIDFDSYDDAVVFRDEVATYLDDEILTIGDTDDDEVLQAFVDLHTAVVADVTTRGGNLERVKTVRLRETLPALAVTYEQYDSAERDQDLIDRNKIRHPGFVPGGSELQVLV
jgi:prophage DNA circulation protein